MIPRGLTPQEFRLLLLSVGSGRRDRPLSPLEVAALLHKSLDAGEPVASLADSVHLDGPTMIGRFLRLLDLAPAVHHMVHWGRTGVTVSFSAASEVARLAGYSAHEEAFCAALEHGLSGGEVKAVVQQQLRSHKLLSECIRDIVGMRPQVVHLHLLVGAITAPELRHALAGMSQKERDEHLRLALDHVLPELHDIPSRLGTDRFTLAYDENREALVHGHKAGMELLVTEALAKSVATRQRGVDGPSD